MLLSAIQAHHAVHYSYHTIVTSVWKSIIDLQLISINCSAESMQMEFPATGSTIQRLTEVSITQLQFKTANLQYKLRRSAVKNAKISSKPLAMFLVLVQTTFTTTVTFTFLITMLFHYSRTTCGKHVVYPYHLEQAAYKQQWHSLIITWQG